MIFTVKIVSHFSAAHSLLHYEGKCEALHGHNWKVEVLVSGEELDASGMVMDFGELKRLTRRVLDELDHSHLNVLPYFIGSCAGPERSPSSEEIARYIFINLEKTISQRSYWLKEVRVWETENSCAVYSKT